MIRSMQLIIQQSHDKNKVVDVKLLFDAKMVGADKHINYAYMLHSSTMQTIYHK